MSAPPARPCREGSPAHASPRSCCSTARRLLEVGAIRQSLDGRDRSVLEGAVQRDGDKLLAVGQRGARAPRGSIRARRGAQSTRESARRRRGRARAPRPTRASPSWRCARGSSGSDSAPTAARLSGFAGLFERFERDVAEHRRGVRPHAAVGIVTIDEREHRRIHQLPDGGAADSRALVLARERRELFAFVDRQASTWASRTSGSGCLVTGSDRNRSRSAMLFKP